MCDAFAAFGGGALHDDVVATVAQIVDAACKPHAAEEAEGFEAGEGEAFL